MSAEEFNGTGICKFLCDSLKEFDGWNIGVVRVVQKANRKAHARFEWAHERFAKRNVRFVRNVRFRPTSSSAFHNRQIKIYNFRQKRKLWWCTMRKAVQPKRRWGPQQPACWRHLADANASRDICKTCFADRISLPGLLWHNMWPAAAKICLPYLR